MTTIVPTQNQRDKYFGILQKHIDKLDQELSQVQRQYDSVESIISKKQKRRRVSLETLWTAVIEYCGIYDIKSLGLTASELENNRIKAEKAIRSFIEDELDLKRTFDNQKKNLRQDSQSDLSELEKLSPGKLRHFERRSIQKRIDVVKVKLSEISELKYPRAEKIEGIQAQLNELNLLDTTKEEKNRALLLKKILALKSEIEEFNLKLVGEAFEIACAEYVETEREKRREAVRKRERAAQTEERRHKREAQAEDLRRKRQAAQRKRQKALNDQHQRARAATLKTRLKKNERFLAENSEKTVRSALRVQRRAAETLKQQCSRAEEACVRKVKQIRLTTQRNLVPKLDRDPLLIAELTKRDWPMTPSLDNLVAKLKEKYSDYEAVNEEVAQLESLLNKISTAKDEIEEFNKVSHLLFSTGGKAKASPPRISVENWEDAEELALRYIKWLGFHDARRTRAGSDEGKDVESTKCVAQVKDMGTGATRPMLQQLFGVASAEKKIPIFFSRSYARTALEWGEQHKIALFKFDLRGTVTPMSVTAKKLASG